jgi:predicted  nucleic acid-binding Zn-ribbon protein
MGPTNVALVKLFQADQQLRAARERLDAAAKNVRVQDRRVNDTAAKLKAAQQHHREQQARAGTLDLDLRTRDAHIEKLRTQQQSAKNNKEYQAFLIEINTAKVDKAKVEDEAMRALEQVERAAAESATLATQLEGERARHAEMSAQIGETLKTLQAEVDALLPARQAAAAGLSAKVLAEFDRLAERFDGEPMSALAKPDRRREEYLCTACNMDLVTDVYNKLHSRDELVYCPSCRRLLYIPEDLPPEAAINVKGARPAASEGAPARAKAPRVSRARASKAGKAAGGDGSAAADGGADVVIEPRAKGKLGQVLARAQGESVSRAAAADHKPFEFEVFIDDKLAGIYKGNSAENLERAIKYFLGEAGLSGAVRVVPLAGAPSAGAEPAAASAPAASGSGSALPDPQPVAGGESPQPVSPSSSPSGGDRADSRGAAVPQPAEADAPTSA